MAYEIFDKLIELLQCPKCQSPLNRTSLSLECMTCGSQGKILSSNLVSFRDIHNTSTNSILSWPREKVGSIEAGLIALNSRKTPKGEVTVTTVEQTSQPDETPSDSMQLLSSFRLIGSDGHLTRLGSLLQYHSLEYDWQKNYDVLENLISTADLKPDPRILDVGCGAGQTLRRLDIPSPGLFVGVDLDIDALALGSMKTPENGTPGLFCCSSAHTLPFRDKAFDLVICRGSINYCHQKRCLEEAIRVLPPGGWLFCRVERIWWDLNMLSQSRSWLSILCHLRHLIWGLLHDLTGFQQELGGVLPGWRAYLSKRRLRRIIEPLGCELLKFEGSSRGPQFWGRGTQAKVLCRRSACTEVR